MIRFNIRVMLIMLSPKEEAIKLIEEMPKEVTWDEIIYKFYVKKKLNSRLQEAKNGNVVSHEKIKKRLLS